MKTFALTASIAVAVLVTAGNVTAQDQDAATDFAARVSAYVALHRQVERYVAPQRLFVDPEKGARAVAGLAQAMRRVRAGAQEGDIFSPAISREFRTRIRHALAVNAVNVAAIFDQMRADGGEIAPVPSVNETFSWALGNVMPAFMLQVLPPLPDELQYRFVGWDLVLIDMHADLVVDVLRDALPDETEAAR